MFSLVGSSLIASNSFAIFAQLPARFSNSLILGNVCTDICPFVLCSTLEQFTAMIVITLQPESYSYYSVIVSEERVRHAGGAGRARGGDRRPRQPDRRLRLLPGRLCIHRAHCARPLRTSPAGILSHLIARFFRLCSSRTCP